MDLVVNHMLVSCFGFDRARLTIADKLCWVDTIFPGMDVPTDQAFEYYYNLLVKDVQSDGGPGGAQPAPGSGGSNKKPIDDHSNLPSFDDEALDNIAEELSKQLSDDELSKLNDSIKDQVSGDKEGDATTQQAGTGLGGRLITVNIGKVAKKKKWETVIKNWASRYIQTAFKNVEQWARMNRRFAFIASSLMIPTEMEDDGLEKDKNKVKVWFFQDTSGSCSGFAKRFFKAAASLPPDRFDVKMHCFDTRVYETTIESGKLYGFGGTRFDILETYIQSQTNRESKNYPDAVFVITDGYGTTVLPKQPKRWYWFLSGNYKRYIPQESNVYKLADFE